MTGLIAAVVDAGRAGLRIAADAVRSGGTAARASQSHEARALARREEGHRQGPFPSEAALRDPSRQACSEEAWTALAASLATNSPVRPVPFRPCITSVALIDEPIVGGAALESSRDDWVLRCESTKPEFQEPIVIGHPDAEHRSDDEVRVIGIVLRSYQKQTRRFF